MFYQPVLRNINKEVLRSIKLRPEFSVTLSGLEGAEVPEADQVAFLYLVPDCLDHGLQDPGGFGPGEAVFLPDHFGKFAVVHILSTTSIVSVLRLSRWQYPGDLPGAVGGPGRGFAARSGSLGRHASAGRPRRPPAVLSSDRRPGCWRRPLLLLSGSTHLSAG